MDIAGELLAIHRSLRAPAFQKGDAVRDDSGRSGTVVGARLEISEKGIGNEFEVLWADEKRSWINGGLLIRVEGDGAWSIGTNSSRE